MKGAWCVYNYTSTMNMGEKIMDLYPINIGNSTLMIELNEGYSNEGRVIHIQNEKFRYLFTENDFFKASANILRANSELRYVRLSRSEKRKRLISENYVYNTSTPKLAIFNKFRQNNLQFLFLETVNNLTTILIRPGSYNEYRNTIIHDSNINLLHHPYGNMFGYRFLYQMYPFEIFETENNYVEVYFQLPCLSLTPKTWIPLDKIIQDRIWRFDNQTHIDDLSFLIYKITWAIFKNGCFNEDSVKVISRLIPSVDRNEFHYLLSLVFYGFTDDLVNYLYDSQYHKIIQDFFAFSNY